MRSTLWVKVTVTFWINENNPFNYGGRKNEKTRFDMVGLYSYVGRLHTNGVNVNAINANDIDTNNFNINIKPDTNAADININNIDAETSSGIGH
ncbi:MAG: hypothetical protein HY863_14645 [Chloroflexi bacterium]|nr:hypothetical protein [Chloroflexota bacterium]